VAAHARPLLVEALPRLQGWRISPLVVVRQGRVAIGDEIARALRADIAVVLIGERPGLSAPDSMGAYLTFRPTPPTTHADRLRHPPTPPVTPPPTPPPKASPTPTPPSRSRTSCAPCARANSRACGSRTIASCSTAGEYRLSRGVGVLPSPTPGRHRRA